MSGLLMNERFVAVFPSLVRLLGSLESAVLLQHMHWHADEDGTIKVTQATLSEETGIALRTVERRVRWLRDEGWLTSERSAAYDATLTYRIDLDRLRSGPHPATLADSSPHPANLADSDTANLATSSLQKVRTTTPVGREPSPSAVSPAQHPSRPITRWEPRPEFIDYLTDTYSHVTVGPCVTRFVNYHLAKQDTSKSWEALLENWVSSDNERAEAQLLTGTDDLGTPRTQRRRSAVPDAPQPGDPDYFDAAAYATNNDER